MPNRPARNPLHGVTLEAMLHRLVEGLGWEAMAQRVDIRCFQFEPSVKSSLHFLRRTPWARAKVEQLYLEVAKDTGSEGPGTPPAASPSELPPVAAASRYLGAGGQDRAALRAHALNRSHAHLKSDNRAKV